MTNSRTFKQMKLTAPLQATVTGLGYETPTPIQAQAIPVLMEGADLLAQAQTGTGKTAAFALPILSEIDLTIESPQALILTPTREIAIQVAQAFENYASGLPNFRVAPIYGGQDYRIQLRALKRGPHVIVGTPGRMMDHLERGSLFAESINTVVLDEADEMLKMGFIDDIQWILEQIPNEHQTALFSATMPQSIQKIAKRYLNNPRKIEIKASKSTASNIEQYYICTTKKQKFETLKRFLEVETVTAAVVFARTKSYSAELTEQLQASGYSAATLNGDMNQSHREKVIGQFKAGSIDMLVATDVAARGIDVKRVSHVINYDAPHDTESYIHRIGRTGRAGRTGKALLFLSNQERRILKDIERALQQTVKEWSPPTLKQMQAYRMQRFSEKIQTMLDKPELLAPYNDMLEELVEQTGGTYQHIAAALVQIMQQPRPAPAKIEYAGHKETDRFNKKSKPNKSRKNDAFKSNKNASDKKKHKKKFSKSHVNS